MQPSWFLIIKQVRWLLTTAEKARREQGPRLPEGRPPADPSASLLAAGHACGSCRCRTQLDETAANGWCPPATAAVEAASLPLCRLLNLRLKGDPTHPYPSSSPAAVAAGTWVTGTMHIFCAVVGAGGSGVTLKFWGVL